MQSIPYFWGKCGPNLLDSCGKCGPNLLDSCGKCGNTPLSQEMWQYTTFTGNAALTTFTGRECGINHIYRSGMRHLHKFYGKAAFTPVLRKSGIYTSFTEKRHCTTFTHPRSAVRSLMHPRSAVRSLLTRGCHHFWCRNVTFFDTFWPGNVNPRQNVTNFWPKNGIFQNSSLKIGHFCWKYQFFHEKCLFSPKSRKYRFL